MTSALSTVPENGVFPCNLDDLFCTEIRHMHSLFRLDAGISTRCHA